MRAHANLIAALASGIALIATMPRADADEFGFSTYGLGAAAFGAA